LLPMEVEMLGRVVVHVEQAHGVGEEGVPPDREVHASAQGLLGLTVEPPVQRSVGAVSLSSQPRPAKD